MLQNYLKIAWRNLLLRKFYSVITIVGLSVGLTFSFLMISYIRGELNVNHDFKNADRQYLVRSKWKQPEMGLDITTLAPLGKTLREEYPNLVSNYYRYDGITVAISRGDRHFREEVQSGDSTLLSMYGLPLLYGNPVTALNQPNSVAITEDKARKFFGKTDVLGEFLTLHNFQGGKQNFQVTAVLKNLANNSVNHLLGNQAGIFVPFNSIGGRKGFADSWAFQYMVTYIELREGVTARDLEKPLRQIVATNGNDNAKANLEVYLSPLRDYYLEANDGLVKKMIFLLSGVTVFILVMAIVNFINISIGKSSSRLKEIGVRKVLGGLRKQLVGQFLAESILLSFVSMLFSLGLYEVCRPFFSELLGQPLASLLILFPASLLVPLLLSLLIGLLGGIYPAFILSSLPSVDSMKGKLKSIKENTYLRRLLVGGQFAVAAFVFAAAFIISQQVNFFFNKDLGYHKESLLTVAVPRDWSPEGLVKMEAVREEMSHLKEITDVSLSYEIPNGNSGANFGVYHLGQDSLQAIHTQFLGTDENYANTYQIRLKAGRFFHNKNEAFRSDRIVLNEAAARALGYRNVADAIGRQVRVYNFPAPLTIAGVTENFHFESVHKAIKPLAFVHIDGGTTYRFLTIRLAAGNVAGSMNSIEKKFRELMPDAPFEYNFLDDTLQKLYKSEIQLRSASGVATVLAIIIVLLGVMGMVSLSVARRTRELGIRKVLGASSFSITMIFLYEFLLVFVLAVIVSFPLVYIFMHKWLETYAYHVALGWQVFAFTGLIFITLIAALVSLQTWKAARMDPAKIIRME